MSGAASGSGRGTGSGPRRPPVQQRTSPRGGRDGASGGDDRASENRPRHRPPVPGRAQAIANPSGYGAAGLAAAAPTPRPEEPGRTRHLRVVESGRRRLGGPIRRTRAIVVAAIAIGSCIAFALVYLHVVLAQRQFRIDRLDSQTATAEINYQNLRLKVAQLGSPQQIVSTAEGKLGMVQPTKVVYLTPTPSSSTPDRAGGSAGPAPTGGQPASTTQTGASPVGNANWPLIKSEMAGTP